MEITFLGHSSFKIKSKSGILVTDPFSSSMVGFKFPKVEADIVTVSHSHQDHNFVAGVGGDPFIISSAGEYEVKGISVFGFPSFHDSAMGKERGNNIIFVIEADGFRVCHLGDLGDQLTTRLLEEIGDIDILMVPVGGTFTLDSKQAVEVVNQVEPLIILPMHYKEAGISEQNFGFLSGVDEFLSQMGAVNTEKLDKLTLIKDKLPSETKTIILERKE